MPYKSTKRPVIVQKVKPQIQAAPRNVIIEYEKPKAIAIRQVIEEGIIRADPATYQSQPSNGEIKYVDRITDLPIENSNILSQLTLDSSSSAYRSSNHSNYYSDNSSSTYSKLTNNNNNASSSSLKNSSASSSSTSAGNCLNKYSDTKLNINNNNNFSSTGINEINSDLNFYINSLFASSFNPTFSSSSSSNSSYNYIDNNSVEYETITTSVPESLAAKIIAEAQAAGAISKSANNNPNCYSSYN